MKTPKTYDEAAVREAREAFARGYISGLVEAAYRREDPIEGMMYEELLMHNWEGVSACALVMIADILRRNRCDNVSSISAKVTTGWPA